MSAVDDSFVAKIAAAWLDAAEFYDRKMQYAREAGEISTHWEHRADRCDKQAKLVNDLTLGKPIAGTSIQKAKKK